MSDRFREVARRIFSSLDLESALFDAYAYLKGIMPLDGAFITSYDHGQKKARVIALACAEGGVGLDEMISISDGTWEMMGVWHEESRQNPTPWIRDHTHPINKEFIRLVKHWLPSVRTRPEGSQNLCCTISCALKSQGEIMGNLILAAAGESLYNDSHVEVMKDICEPFGMALANAMRFKDLVRDHQALQRDTRQMTGDVMIGAHGGLSKVRRLIEQVAPTESPVLLLGETGTGKEVVAGEIHKLSPRCKGPLIRLNCGAIPESLMDSELFGHQKGAFTGAFETSVGRFERASGGTLFLDEIGELPMAAQVKLLRVLQSGEFERVGGTRVMQADVRIIAATHRNLEAMVAEGTFRSDLWFRLHVFPLSIPPLRKRTEDIPAMVDHFILHKTREMNLSYRPCLAEGALAALMDYPWPGNVRELQNLVERALILSGGRPLRFETLLDRPAPRAETKVWEVTEPLSGTFDDMAASWIRKALVLSHGKVSGPNGAADRLGLHPNTLRSKMKKYGIRLHRRVNVN
ncbi:sigma-54-dependent transcriptional regulator [Desulfoluna spongiiphila]|uniref:Transcriptional regulator containing GAF, AAA-type ATPase, and DNA-binding Fis domains n=1 Tax=Desulfoluna spongiiphila TaxID=419481 RepID=A0A1G5CJ25_9BACT|nr:sigma-54 dependent transcriptional regulator [Desulfoluna spongiiphila]SCY02413.1 Transcriptional regulator containing GAF, AAA-type ATPase, and DNA-binding Fis domains [Desulfoluna spongiiphila]VVS92242.1 rna polymerase sigma factor 54 interaction domain [Desulfoluna spongiiphila]